MLAGSLRRINDGVLLVSQTEASFQSLVATADEVAQLVGGITVASQSQARAIQDIHQSIALMDKVTQENAVEAAETENISKALNGQATLLSRAVKRIAAILHGGNQTSSAVRRSPAQEPKMVSLSEVESSSLGGAASDLVDLKALESSAAAPKKSGLGQKSKKVSQKALENAIPMDDDF
jgi:hypothetical protein